MGARRVGSGRYAARNLLCFLKAASPVTGRRLPVLAALFGGEEREERRGGA
jgi:hypothetical protein